MSQIMCFKKRMLSKIYECDQDGCTLTFSTEKGKRQHEKDFHPHLLSRECLDSGTIFDTIKMEELKEQIGSIEDKSKYKKLMK